MSFSLFVPPEIWEMILKSKEKEARIKELELEIRGVNLKCHKCKKYTVFRFDRHCDFCEHVYCGDCSDDQIKHCDVCESKYDCDCDCTMAAKVATANATTQNTNTLLLICFGLILYLWWFPFAIQPRPMKKWEIILEILLIVVLCCCIFYLNI